jgi:hypothetical protein
MECVAAGGRPGYGGAMGSPRVWVLAATTAAAIGCTTGVEDNGFTGTFTGPPANTTDPPGVSTFDEETMGSEAGSGVVTMGGSADDTSGPGSTSSPGSTSEPGSTTSEPGSTTNPEDCNPPCAADEMCVLGACEPIPPPACNDVPGNYAECLGAGNVIDTSGCGGIDSCVTGGDPVIAGVCSVTPCTDTCDCPEAPATGNAPIACDNITGGVEQFCYLDCSGGQTCPNGMTCFGALACVWPGEGADGVPYGDCLNGDPSTCGLDGVCLNDNVMAPSVGVCTQGCAGAGSCPASPGGTAPVTCEDITDDGEGECWLDCSLGRCPGGMTCYGGFICMWD